MRIRPFTVSAWTERMATELRRVRPEVSDEEVVAACNRATFERRREQGWPAFWDSPETEARIEATVMRSRIRFRKRAEAGFVDDPRPAASVIVVEHEQPPFMVTGSIVKEDGRTVIVPAQGDGQIELELVR